MQNKRTLLLNASYEVLNFIDYRKALKLLAKDKCEVLSSWEEIVVWSSGKIYHPATLRLKNLIRRNFYNSNFSRQSVIKRDQSLCQYCGIKLSSSQITIDHVLPRAQGGITSFINCVVACKTCNNKKDNKTPEQANMKLLKKPSHPSFSEHFSISENQEFWNSDWDNWIL